MLSKTLQLGAAGNAGEKVYVDDVFSTDLYDGTGSTQSIVNGIDLSGEGGMVWVKSRDSASFNHQIGDTERGVNNNLSPDTSAGNYTHSGKFTAFNSNGFTIGNNGAVNNDPNIYASWTFRKCPGFFDIIEWTGNSTAGRTISHNLESVPGAIFVKRKDGAGNWSVFHREMNGNGDGYLHLNNTNAAQSAGELLWGDGNNFIAPTSTTITLGSDSFVNYSGYEYIAYIFAHNAQSFGDDGDEAIIKCGSYTGTGTSSSSEGPEINLGFEPQWLLVRNYTSSSSPNWIMEDVMRGFNYTQRKSQYITTAAEFDFDDSCLVPTSTGFKVLGDNYQYGKSGNSYIYIAIRRPHKPPEAGTDVFNAATQVGTVPNFAASFPVDLGIKLFTSGGNSTYAQLATTRLQGEEFLATSQSNAAAAAPNDFVDWNHMDGWGDQGGGGTGLSFKRAPGFMDVVAWTGNGTAGRAINHNLGAVPELMVVKRRDSSELWAVYDAINGNTSNLQLQADFQAVFTNNFWNNTSPTSTTFTVRDTQHVNITGGTYIAYLFASLDGISKIGSYTGTGNNLSVNCGFAAGARFVLIKRTDSSGDWWVFDTSRGIVSNGNDPAMRLNLTNAQVTNTNYLEPNSNGFTVTSTAGAGLNASGGTYLYLAIA